MDFINTSIPKQSRNKYEKNSTQSFGGSNSFYTGGSSGISISENTDLTTRILDPKVLLIPSATPIDLDIIVPDERYSLSIMENGITGQTPPSVSFTVIDSLLSTSVTDALSANQGKILKELVDSKASSSAWADITGKPTTLNGFGISQYDTLFDTRYIITETDPTVPSWAKQPSKPSYSKYEIGLGNVNNTADANKSVLYASTAGSATASDVYAWAKAATKPTYTFSEVGAAASSHTHNYLPLSGGTMSGSIDGVVNITASGKIEAQVFVIPASAPSNPDSNKWYLYIE